MRNSKPFISLVRDIFEVPKRVSVYSDKRINGRRIKICMSMNPTQEQIDELDEYLFLYNLKLINHFCWKNDGYARIAKESYVFHFENI